MKNLIVISIFVIFGGCTNEKSLNRALGTPKNPTAIFSDPVKNYYDESKFIVANYGVLLEAIDSNSKTMKSVENTDMRRYLGAGYNLSDIYCSRYFAKTDESYRRRRFGRTLTNDAGAAVTTVLGLVNAGQSAVTALAATTGLADSLWRNYDDSFVISPELATVRSLVFAAQDNFRERTLGKNADLPGDFGTAQSTIQRYAQLCSFLGMKTLLEQSATKQQTTLNDNTQFLQQGGIDKPGDDEKHPTVPERPAGAILPLTPNKGNNNE